MRTVNSKIGVGLLELKGRTVSAMSYDVVLKIKWLADKKTPSTLKAGPSCRNDYH